MTEYYIISKEDFDKIRNPYPYLSIVGNPDTNAKSMGFQAGKQSVLSKAQKIDLDELFPVISKRINAYLFKKHYNTVWRDEELILANGLMDDIVSDFLKGEKK